MCIRDSICCADMKTNKAEIYKNAFRLFLQDNYKKVTVVNWKKLSDCRVGVSHHAKDKQGLFKAVVNTYIFEPHKMKNKFVYFIAGFSMLLMKIWKHSFLQHPEL